MPKMALEKVSIAKAKDSEDSSVKKAIREPLDLLGGLGRFVHSREKVVLKPNLAVARLPGDPAITSIVFISIEKL